MNGEIDSLKVKQIELSLNYHKNIKKKNKQKNLLYLFLWYHVDIMFLH